MADQNHLLKCLHQKVIRTHRLIVAGYLAASIFVAACELGGDVVKPKPEGFTNASMKKPIPAANESSDSSKETMNRELPKELLAAVQAEYKVSRDQINLVLMVDLDGDNRRDAILKILGDYSGFCGSTVAILRNEVNRFRIISEIGCISEIAVDKKRTNGWLDLLVSSREGHFRLTFNGKSYPPSPLEGKPEKRTTL